MSTKEYALSGWWIWERNMGARGATDIVYDKAIDDFKKTREFCPPCLAYGKDFYVEATKNLGIVYREMGDDEKAKFYLEEALKRAEMPEVGMSITAKEIRELF